MNTQLSLFDAPVEIPTPKPQTEEAQGELSPGGAVAAQMYERIRDLTHRPPRECFNTLVRVLADAVRLVPLPEGDHAAADAVAPLWTSLVNALEAERPYDPLGEVFTRYQLGGEGQVLTPRWVVQYIVDHTIGQGLKQAQTEGSETHRPLTVLDPCVGTGRFLIDVAQRYGVGDHQVVLFGVELDLDLYRACLVNMRLLALPTPYFILWADTLVVNLKLDSPNWERANLWDPPDWRTMEPAGEGMDLSEIPPSGGLGKPN